MRASQEARDELSVGNAQEESLLLQSLLATFEGGSSRLPQEDPGFEVNMEEAVIGTCLAFSDCAGEIAGLLKPEHFRNESLGQAWILLTTMAAEGAGIDLLSFRDRIRRDGLSDVIGPHERYVTLALEALTPRHIKQYAARVREDYETRALFGAVARINHIVQQPGPAHERYSRSMLELSKVDEARVRQHSRGPKLIGDSVPAMLKSIEDAHSRGGGLAGIPTGLRDFDAIVAGLCPGDLIIVAARPGMGKTAMALGIAKFVAEMGKKVFFSSTEMSAQQLSGRLAAMESRIDSHKLRTGNLDENEWAALTHASNRIVSLPIVVDDRTGISGPEICSAVRSEHVRGPVGLVLVDYIQRLEGDPSMGQFAREDQKIARNSGCLKNLAGDLEVPVVVLAQLSRIVERRENKRPMLSDLRESGALEQDADVVVFIYRDEYYNAQSAYRGIAEAIVAKQRNGPCGTAYLSYVSKLTLFGDKPFGWSPPASGMMGSADASVHGIKF